MWYVIIISTKGAIIIKNGGMFGSHGTVRKFRL
jgi:hypothetical protein